MHLECSFTLHPDLCEKRGCMWFLISAFLTDGNLMLLELLEASSNNISVVSSSIIVLNGFCGGWLAGLFCIFCLIVDAL